MVDDCMVSIDPWKNILISKCVLENHHNASQLLLKALGAYRFLEPRCLFMESWNVYSMYRFMFSSTTCMIDIGMFQHDRSKMKSNDLA